MRVPGPVSHLDLWPTILGALGLPSGDAAGLDLLASSPPAPPPGRAVPQFLGSQWSLTDGQHRLLWNEGRVSLFDASGDPLEESDIAAREPEAVRALVQLEREMLRRLRPRMLEPARTAEDPHEARGLEALGYGGADEDAEPPGSAAPRGE